MKHYYVLNHSTARRNAMAAVEQAPEGWIVQVSEPKRNLEQSAKFHAMCADIARQVEFAGQLRTAEQWKVLLVSGHAIATKQGSEMVPGLEGEWCNIRESTASMGIKRMASLIEYTYAYGADKNVAWSA